MSSIVLGGSVSLKIGTASADTSISGVASGTDQLQLGIGADVTQIPGGRGVVASTVGRFRTFDFSFITDSNEVTDPLLVAANGSRLHFEIGPFAGKTYTGEGIATVTRVFNVQTNRIVYNVRLAVDGVPTIS